MTGYLMHAGATVQCPHGGHATYLATQTRVQVTGNAAADLAGLWTVVGCPLPQPCVTIRWLSPAARVQVTGSPAELSSPTGTCLNAGQVPQGPAVISVVQHRAVGQ